MGPFEGAEFWNPKVRGPLCYNPPAARSVLPLTYKRTEMVLAGLIQSADASKPSRAHTTKKNCLHWNPARCAT